MDISTPALLFPAVSLLLLAYTNRFLAVASLIRLLSNQIRTKEDCEVNEQINNLRRRLELTKWMQLFGVISILLCTVSRLFVGCFFFRFITFCRYDFHIKIITV